MFRLGDMTEARAAADRAAVLLKEIHSCDPDDLITKLPRGVIDSICHEARCYSTRQL